MAPGLVSASNPLFPPFRVVPESGFWLLNKEVIPMIDWRSRKTEKRLRKENK